MIARLSRRGDFGKACLECAKTAMSALSVYLLINDLDPFDLACLLEDARF